MITVDLIYSTAHWLFPTTSRDYSWIWLPRILLCSRSCRQC